MAISAPAAALSHWHKPYDGLETSTLDFYEAVEAALRVRKLPGIDTTRALWQEGGAFSADREYLRVKGHGLCFDICAAPYGTGYFFSWWLTKRTRQYWLALVLLAVACPFVVGQLGFRPNETVLYSMVGTLALLAIAFVYRRRPQTLSYYQVDTILTFQSLVQAAVNEAIDGTLQAKGLRALTEEEKKPIMRSFLNR